MEKNYNQIIQERVNHVFEVMAQRVSSEDLSKIKEAFELAQKAHAPQIRKSGEPYILHPPDFVNAYPKIHQRIAGRCVDGVS